MWEVSLVHRIIPLLIFATCGLALSLEARADAFYKFVETSCYPDVGYFSLKTDGIYNVDPKKLYSPKTVASSIELENKPTLCKLSDKITIEVKGYCRNQLFPKEVLCTAGYGPGVEYVGVFINGKVIPLGQNNNPPVTDWMHYYHRKFYPDHSLAISSSAKRKNNKIVPIVNVRHCSFRNNSLARYDKPTNEKDKGRGYCQSFEMSLEDSE